MFICVIYVLAYFSHYAKITLQFFCAHDRLMNEFKRVSKTSE